MTTPENAARAIEDSVLERHVEENAFVDGDATASSRDEQRLTPSQAQRFLDLPRCRHGLLLDAYYGDLECRVCVSPTQTVADFRAVHGDAEQTVVGEVFGVTRQAIQNIERRALAKFGARFAKRFPDLAARGDMLSDADRLARVVRRMLNEAMPESVIAEVLNEPIWRVANAVRKNRKR